MQLVPVSNRLDKLNGVIQQTKLQVRKLKHSGVFCAAARNSVLKILG